MRRMQLPVVMAVGILSPWALAADQQGSDGPVTAAAQGPAQATPPAVLEAEEEEPLVTDRPDFTEASSTVGRGRVQIESGYTYFHDSTREHRLNEHVLPELLVRIGLTDELELRLGWLGYLWSRELDRATGSKDTVDGGIDMDVGFKLELTEQCHWFPETAIIQSISLPTGADAFSADRVQYVSNFLFSWELSDCLSVGGSTGISSLREEGDDFLLAFQSLTAAWSWNDQLGSYFEWFGLFRTNSEDNGPEHFLNGGFTYLVTPNLQLDWRAGFGLNQRSTDFFTGVGLSVRY